MTDNRTTELQSLSKLKKAGKLRYWRGTIEIPETELHAICDEIQAEYDSAVHALNKAAGNWAKADAELREKHGFALKRCPICGYEADFWNTPHVGGLHDCAVLDSLGFAVECTNCGLTTRGYSSMSYAAEVWNTRAKEALDD